MKAGAVYPSLHGHPIYLGLQKIASLVAGEEIEHGGQPGDIILQQKGEKPEYTNLNKFYRYTFDSPLALQSGTYYVGWVQVSTTFLNVGFDVNHNSGSRIFYNIDGTWNKSIYSGSLMIRPIFGSAKDISTPTPIDPPATVSGITLYPNPMSENEIYDLLKDFKYIIPQGSPMAGIGNNFQVASLSNCFVIGNNG